MKKILMILITLILIPINVKALTIDSLGLSIDLPQGYNVTTREDKNALYDFYDTNVYLKMEDYLGSDMYIRVVQNPGITNYEVKKDLLDEVHSLIQIVNTNEYAYVDSNGYRFIKFEYKTKDNKNELVEYYLSWKDLFITITFQSKESTLTQAMKDTTDDIIKTIKLTGNGIPDGKHVDSNKIDYFVEPNRSITKYVVEVIICSIVIFITYKVTRRRK
ncbi:MAG: hypothetical protein K6C11_02230 [Bacilli bacterium]|nr:hypothetical protein [Bacilli bacterium]